jgi:hypothetical protein
LTQNYTWRTNKGEPTLKVNWKTVGMGVVAASVGAAAFGAIQYLFLGGALPNDIIPGVSNGVLFPILLGALGLVIGYGWAHGIVKDILVAGSAASVGFGIATYVGWIQAGPAAAKPAGATAASARYAPPPMRTAPLPMMAAANQGTKMI